MIFYIWFYIFSQKNQKSTISRFDCTWEPVLKLVERRFFILPKGKDTAAINFKDNLCNLQFNSKESKEDYLLFLLFFKLKQPHD